MPPGCGLQPVPPASPATHPDPGPLAPPGSPWLPPPADDEDFSGDLGPHGLPLLTEHDVACIRELGWVRWGADIRWLPGYHSALCRALTGVFPRLSLLPTPPPPTNPPPAAPALRLTSSPSPSATAWRTCAPRAACSTPWACTKPRCWQRCAPASAGRRWLQARGADCRSASKSKAPAASSTPRLHTRVPARPPARPSTD